MRNALLLLAAMCQAANLSAARAPSGGLSTTVRGTIRDAATGEPLAAANIRLLGSSRGTISNTAGEYALVVDADSCRLLFTMLGFAPDTVALTAGRDTRHDVRLQPADIILPEVVVTPEDPAIGIIRRAIDNKQRWIDRLHSYALRAFTRQTYYRDTAIAAIYETYSRGYWRLGDTLREVVTERRQTANVPADANFASVGRILNFTDDEINFLGYRFVGPTARNALDYYDYRLIRTRSSAGTDIYEIRMIPRTRLVPLFEGTVMIAGGSYALVGVDVRPNETFELPLIKDIAIRYRQEFGLYESSYWMPSDIRIDASFSIKLIGFSFPRMRLTHTSVISDYDINTALPDSIFGKPRLRVDSTAARFDSTFWAQNTVLPLDTAEQRAYRTLDSTQTLEVQFRPGGFAMNFGGNSGGLGVALSSLDLTFNRVEGFHTGALVDVDTVTGRLSLRGGAAYGFSSKLTTYTAGMTWYADGRRSLGIGGNVYRSVAAAPDHGYYGGFWAGFAALTAKEDFADYYRAEGENIFVRVRHSPILRWTLTYTSERESPLPLATNYSLLRRSAAFRANPAAVPGRLSSLRWDARIGHEPFPFDLILQDGLDLSLEHASPSLTGGNFDFTRYDAVLSFSVPTFARSFFLSPGFRVRAYAGGAWGTLPVQRFFGIEGTLNGGTPFGAMHGLDQREYTGTGYAAVSVEHNFRSLPFLALGIPFLYTNGIELILFGGAARTWGVPASPGGEMHGTYREAGFGISRILDLFRVDFAWRLSAPRGFAYTIGVAPIL